MKLLYRMNIWKNYAVYTGRERAVCCYIDNICCLGIGIEIWQFIGICLKSLILLVCVWASPQVLVETCKVRFKFVSLLVYTNCLRCWNMHQKINITVMLFLVKNKKCGMVCCQSSGQHLPTLSHSCCKTSVFGMLGQILCTHIPQKTMISLLFIWLAFFGLVEGVLFHWWLLVCFRIMTLKPVLITCDNSGQEDCIVGGSL